MAEWSRFRAEFGLNSDSTFMAALAQTVPPSAEFGVPLTPDEERLMSRRSSIPSELDGVQEYRKAHASTWGGMWLTYPPDLPAGIALQINVAVTSGAEAVTSDIAVLVPKDVQLVVSVVRHTEADLNALVNRIASDGDFFRGLVANYHGYSVFLGP